MLHPYIFSSNGISLKRCRDVTCTLFLLPLFTHFLVLPSLLQPSILCNCFLYLLLSFFVALEPKLVFSWAIATMMQFAPQAMTGYFVADWLTNIRSMADSPGCPLQYTSTVCDCIVCENCDIGSYRHDT